MAEQTGADMNHTTGFEMENTNLFLKSLQKEGVNIASYGACVKELALTTTSKSLEKLILTHRRTGVLWMLKAWMANSKSDARKAELSDSFIVKLHPFGWDNHCDVPAYAGIVDAIMLAYNAIDYTTAAAEFYGDKAIYVADGYLFSITELKGGYALVWHATTLSAFIQRILAAKAVVSEVAAD